MSRMHSQRKGSSGSKKPMIDKSPEWVQQSPEEIKELVVKLAGEGMSMAKIGLVLRDQYAVPNVHLAVGMSIRDILAEKNIKFELPEDLQSLMKRAVELKGHIKAHKKDLHSLRGQQLIESKIRRLAKYYKREGVIPESWQYSLDTASLQVE
jgi:small subunit ribosomal protein S15